MSYQIGLCQWVIGAWCLTFRDSTAVPSSMDIYVVKMGPPCSIGTSFTDRLVLYCIIQVEEPSSTRYCKGLKNHTASLSYSTTCVDYPYVRTWNQVLLVGLSRKFMINIVGICMKNWFRWSRGSVLTFSTQVCGFKPSRSHQIFRAKKSSARLPSEGK